LELFSDLGVFGIPLDIKYSAHGPVGNSNSGQKKNKKQKKVRRHLGGFNTTSRTDDDPRLVLEEEKKPDTSSLAGRNISCDLKTSTNWSEVYHEHHFSLPT
jgi:hypothetical protein